MMDGEWEFVSKKNSFKGKNINKKLKRNKIIENDQAEIPFDSSEFNEKLTSQITELKSSGFFVYLSENLFPLFKENNFSTIIALGVGSFLSSESSQIQLALFILCLQHLKESALEKNMDFYSINILFFDPLLSQNEKEFLFSLPYGIKINSDNPMGKYKISNFSRNEKAFFYMPHCPYRLYCNVLWSNFEYLSSIVILGNSFQSYCLRRSYDSNARDSLYSKTDLVKHITPFMKEILLWSPRIEKKGSIRNSRAFISLKYDFERAFSDLSLMRLSGDSLNYIHEIDMPTEIEIDNASKQDQELF